MKKDNNSKNKKQNQFEFCQVCKRNHDDGVRHKYFPNHKKALSTFLSRFQSKLTDIRSLLKNPTALRLEHAPLTRLWCVFCGVDIHESHGSSFVCENVIKHLASADHLKELKHFLWKYGSGTDRADSYTVSQADLVKWQKKCEALEKVAVSSVDDATHGDRVGNLNDIHDEFNSDNRNMLRNNHNSFDNVRFDIPCGDVMPLQYFTNENQISPSGSLAATNVGQFVHDGTYSLPLEARASTTLGNTSDVNGNWHRQHLVPYNSQVYSSNLNNGGLQQVYQGKSMSGESSKSQGMQTITQITATTPEEAGGNVHTGAPPPWFDATEGNQINSKQTQVSSSSVSLPSKPGNAHKLNPKRVGAAWAERRKIELEMEKRGAIIKSDSDANWLPNFGRVWQPGSRKDSRKEYDKEKQKLPNVESHSEMPITFQPYVSKRMRRDVLVDEGQDDNHTNERRFWC